MDEVYRLSRFCHSFEEDGTIALYHSLRITPVYLPSIIAKSIISVSRDGMTFSQLEKLSEDSNHAFDPLMLLDAKILVVEGDDEKAITFFRDTALEPEPPEIAYFIMTENCNLACTYCYLKNADWQSEKAGLKNMSVEVAKSALDAFCRMSEAGEVDRSRQMFFYGGEPLMNRKTLFVLLDKIAEYRSSGKILGPLSLTMITNGVLLDADTISRLKNYGVSIVVSVDGSPSVIDSCRVDKKGRGVSAEVLEGVSKCFEQGANVSVSCTLSEAVIADFEGTMQTVLPLLSSKNLGFNLVLESEDYLLPEDYAKKATEFMIRAYETLFEPQGVYEDRIMRKIEAFGNRSVYPSDCGATSGAQVVFAPDGSIGVCQGYVGNRKYFVSDVSDKTFDPTKDTTFREWASRTPLNMSQCQSCSSLGICGGGCPFQSEYRSGSIWELDTQFCTHANILLEWLVWKLYARIKK